MSQQSTLPPAGTPVTVNVTRRGSSLGIGSIVLGVLAFAVCWIPLVGVLGLPLGGLGFLLGVAGILVAAFRRGSSIGLPIAGTALCALALSVTVVLTTAVFSGFRAVAELNRRDNATNQEPAAVVPAGDPAAGPLGGGTTASRAVPPPSTAPLAIANGPAASPPGSKAATKPDEAWAPADAPVRQGDVRVRIVSVRVGSVPVVDAFSPRETKYSTDPLLAVTLELTNLSDTRKLEYVTWAGADLAFDGDYASLRDNFDNVYKRTGFGSTTLPAGRTSTGAIYPGKSLTDVLVFEAPVDRAEYLNLELPAANFRGTGMIRLRIPKAMIVAAPAADTPPPSAGEK